MIDSLPCSILLPGSLALCRHDVLYVVDILRHVGHLRNVALVRFVYFANLALVLALLPLFSFTVFHVVRIIWYRFSFSDASAQSFAHYLRA